MILPFPFLADIEIDERAIFVLVFLVVAFVQWVIKLIKEKAEAATRSQQMPTEAEAEARRRAWGEQTRQAEPTPQPAPARPSGGSLGDLLGEVRKAYEEATHPKPPPPLPRPTVVSTPSRSLAPTAKPVLAAVADSASISSVPVFTLLPKRQPHPVTRQLHTPEGYRQAFILREVLGPPRALQEFRGPED